MPRPRPSHTSLRTASVPRSARLLCAVVACATGLGLLGAASAAAASDYTVWSCRGPAGEPVSAAAWTSAGWSAVDFTDGCGIGGALSVTVPAGNSGTYLDDAGYRFQVRGGTEITGYRIWRSITTAGTHSPSGGFYGGIIEDDFGSAGTPVGRCGNGAGCDVLPATDPAPADPLSSAKLVTRTGLHVHSVSIASGCLAPTSGACVDAGGPGPNAQIRMFRAAFTISDPGAPTLAGDPGGPLAKDEPAAGTQTITVPLADVGAGILGATALVDGQPVDDSQIADCREPYTRPGPCPETTTLALDVDTKRVDDGRHALQVVARDGAGNAATVLTRTITVDNHKTTDPPGTVPTDTTPTVTIPVPPGPMPTVPEVVPPAVPGDYEIRLDRARLTPEHRTLSGRVVLRAGAVVPGAQLVVEERSFGAFDKDWTALRTIAAGADGRFRTTLPSGPRQVRLRYVIPRATTTTFISPAASLFGTIGMSVRRSAARVRNGRSVVLTGRLTGAGTSARGKDVLVDAIVGGRWRAVDRLQAGKDGRVRWSYRFQRTRKEAIYTFRLRVAKDSSRWPWATRSSQRTRVRVVP